MMPLLYLIAVAALSLWGFHALTWRVATWLLEWLPTLPAVRGQGAWERLRPVRAALRAKAPRSYAMLAERFSLDRFTGLPLTLCVLAGLYVAILFGGLTEEVLEAGSVLRFDQAVNDFFAPMRAPSIVAVFVWITALGTGQALTMAATVATAFLWADRRGVFILPLWVTFLGAQATTWSGKYVIARPRPAFLQGVIEASPSFPSGHATASMALYGYIAYAIARDLPGRRARFEVAYWAGALILLITFSRVFLSLHYTTDVSAGLMVGAFWLLTGFAVTEWRRGRAA